MWDTASALDCPVWGAAQDFGRNFANDPTVKIPWVRPDLCGPRVLVMEWIDGIRCTNPAGIQSSGLDVSQFIRCGVVSGLRQLLEAFLFLSPLVPLVSWSERVDGAPAATRPASRASPWMCLQMACAAALSLVLTPLHCPSPATAIVGAAAIRLHRLALQSSGTSAHSGCPLVAC